MGFTIDYDALAAKILGHNPKSVLLQGPDGLKTKLVEIVKELQKRTPYEYVTLVEPAWGSCDLADEKAVKMQCDLLVHFGHNMIYPGKVKTIFWPLSPDINIQPVLDKLVEVLSKENLLEVGLAASSQFTPMFNDIIDYLEKKGIGCHTSSGSGRVKDPGQVLGCNYTVVHNLDEDVQAIVYFGDGLFHPIGIAFSTKKRIITANPYSNTVKELTSERDVFLRKRYALLSQCANATKFGIIVSLKSGQLYMTVARRLKKLIESKGKQAFILLSDFTYPDYFVGLDVDCYVNTACPRLAIENYQEFNKLMINPKELEIALSARKFSEYEFEELLY
ncbi:MAG: diphthamide biosynthesis enzyme Dph2 [Candidatus Diapherotrites archaeon]|nr:diphthamide biosynthesis enzyme Dph2 [Candidatus Diapherotrites archaeon]